jgi:gamma-glutamyltranspeptidase/glutathione hydrolase
MAHRHPRIATEKQGMTKTDTIIGTQEAWQIRKPAVESSQGIVSSQHYDASEAGARVLAEGGNAVDAAVAAAIAIGTVEPFMSGLGGGGHMLVYLAAENRAYNVDFGMRAPLALKPEDYPLVSGTDSDLFGWPAVIDDRNVVGPYSIAVPGFVAGMAAALERFGTRSWSASLAPAIALARRGMDVDWYATLKIAAAAPQLREYVESARVYLPGGHVPAGEWGGPVPRIKLGNLAATLERLSEVGPTDFYTGQIAAQVASDMERLGGSLSAADLAGYEASIVPAQSFPYRHAQIHAATNLTAAPTLRRTLDMLAERTSPGAAPDADMYTGYAGSLLEAYAERLDGLGDDGEATAPTCTTHMSVVDREGNMVALTQTLLSVFGSKVVLPETGILMNNGIMWFDPRPGRPNSLAPGKRPLTNMCPTVVDCGNGVRMALGASGGRRIMPAVMQLISFVVDFGMSVDEACHQPRLDVSGTPQVTVDARLPRALTDHLDEHLIGTHQVVRAPNGVYPALYACPNVVLRDEGRGVNVGGAFVMSPWSKAVAADESS